MGNPLLEEDDSPAIYDLDSKHRIDEEQGRQRHAKKARNTEVTQLSEKEMGNQY